MANSKVTVTFNNNPDDGSEIYISDSLTPSLNMGETFKIGRNNTGETRLGVTKELTAFNYKDAFIWDYNQTILYTVTHTTNTVTIVANNPNSQFTAGFNTTFGDVTIVVENEVPEVAFSIDDISISQSGANPCDKFDITITTNIQATGVLSPINQSVNTNPFTLNLDRAELISLIVFESSGLIAKTASESLKIPKLLSTYFSISKIQTPSGASISVNNSLPNGILYNVEYSINATSWSPNYYFAGLDYGDYTLYIRDSLGCSTSLQFSIDEFVPNLLDYDGICEISNINPIRYKYDVEWNDYTLKNTDNTLSFEEDVILNDNGFVQLFAKRDIVPTQIKTNFKTIEATLIDENGTETALFIDKRTNNMNIEDVRDAQIVSATYNDTQYTAVKFSGGKVYDPLTLEELTDYNIGENVPSWMNADDWLNIEGIGWYKVLDIVYSEDAYVVVINMIANDFPFVLPTTKKVTSVHNLVDWENYEFSINFSDKSGCYKVKVECSDPVFGNKNFLSEWINIKENQENTLLIQSYNSTNNEINFSTGFKSSIRIMYEDVLKWKPNTTQEIHITDTRTTTLENTYRGFWELKATPLPTAMAEKLIMILSQDRLFINNINYVLDGEVESENLGDTNLYEIKANLVKSNYVFNNNSGKYIDLNTIEGTLLSISNGGGFLRVD